MAEKFALWFSLLSERFLSMSALRPARTSSSAEAFCTRSQTMSRALPMFSPRPLIMIEVVPSLTLALKELASPYIAVASSDALLSFVPR